MRHSGTMVAPEEIAAAAAALRAGELVVFPTETVYGLGAHARDTDAVARIFEVKGRPRFDPLIVHLAAPAAVDGVARAVPDAARALAEAFWPGPLTLILPKRPDIPDLVTAGHDTVGVRVPHHPVAHALLAEVGLPIAAPSANRFTHVSPTTADHVRGQLAVDRILDGGPCPVGVESTIVAVLDGRPTLLRPGGLSVEALEGVVGPVEIPAGAALTTLSPGRHERHYAPGTPLRIEADPTPRGPKEGLLTLTPPDDDAGWARVEVLSPTGDLREAAAGLFAALRRLDAAGLEGIAATPVPEAGLGRAIMDRLQRARARNLAR